MPRTELVERPSDGRLFTQTLRPMLADCAPSGRARLDAVARWLQDVAYADVEDAGVAEHAVWVIRRGRLHVKRWPRFGERLRLATFCSGLGRMWAERRTTIERVGEADSDIEAVALWVHLDRDTQRPTPLTREEIEIYGGGAAAERRVSARLRHPPPPEHAPATAWHFRAAERDLAGHINNAAYWQAVEEELLEAEEPAGIDVEIEYRAPAQPGEKRLIADGQWRWIVDGGGEAHASIVIAGADLGPASPPPEAPRQGR
jgi:acyl-ACP thioesterase